MGRHDRISVRQAHMNELGTNDRHQLPALSV
jgi:hypothetical protein